MNHCTNYTLVVFYMENSINEIHLHVEYYQCIIVLIPTRAMKSQLQASFFDNVSMF